MTRIEPGHSLMVTTQSPVPFSLAVQGNYWRGGILWLRCSVLPCKKRERPASDQRSITRPGPLLPALVIIPLALRASWFDHWIGGVEQSTLANISSFSYGFVRI